MTLTSDPSHPRVLLATPYSPAYSHGHAADDIGPFLYQEVGRLVDLTVAAPLPTRRTKPRTVATTYDLVHLSAPTYTKLRLMGTYPAAARKDWSTTNTREFVRLMRSHAFAHVHVEYLQPIEVLASVLPGATTSLTLHDIGTIVSRERAGLARGARRAYFWIDHLRIARHESRAIQAVDHAFALSSRDRDWITAGGGHGELLNLGRSSGPRRWKRPTARKGEFVFAGALWREANQATLRWLISEVAPRLKDSPTPIKIRVVGAEAPGWLIDLCRATPLIDYRGEVDSFEDEYVTATAVLAPTVVSAGILLKAQKALQCGAPLIMNKLAAEPLDLADNACVVADTADDFADAMIRLANDVDLAASIGAAGRVEWLAGSTWADTAATFVERLTRGIS